MSDYQPSKIEKKWQRYWEKERLFQAKEGKQPKFYCLDMFPYPSAEGLHVGHPEGYTASDIYTRYLWMNNYNVLHPMGWDAFGLPTENYAIKKGVHPAKVAAANIETFRRQIKSLGFAYDWTREINTSDPTYYYWTEWMFLQMYKHGLAYRKKAPVNWCTNCQTVLAREQIIQGSCERCSGQVVQKDLTQWFFRITNYVEELLRDLEKIDWPERIKELQRNWIGRSEGVEIEFRIQSEELRIKVFTTRADTLYGVTYLVLAPEHEIIQNSNLTIQNAKEAEEYIEKTKKKTELERSFLEKEKTGVELKGIKAINPVNGQEIPVWIADYVLLSYGTGAIMAVPAHDERDWEFAKKFKLPIVKVIEGGQKENECYTGDGRLVNSQEFTGMSSEKAKEEITKKVGGHKTVQYKLRDWLISRQRYWGAPIPIIYCEKCGEVPVPEKDLPVPLPMDVDFQPRGESPLARSKSFHQVKCPKCKAKARRESDTMDTFVCSSWYFLRYCDPQNDQQFAASDKLKFWCPVDLYVGGAEHAVMHLLYARFFTKALRDFGFLKFDEPFLRLRNQGLILGGDGQKMSKSRGNVINPDDVIKDYGADTMRLYEMFMGPFAAEKPWSTQSIKGIRRFLERIWGLRSRIVQNAKITKETEDKTLINKTIKKVTEDIENFRFNTAISQLMIFTNALGGQQQIPVTSYELLLILLSPFAPHLTEELWQHLGHKQSIFKEKWPKWRKELMAKEEIELVIQINGKLRDKIKIKKNISEEEMKKLAQTEKIKRYLAGKIIKKTIAVKNKLVNFVI